ncbi:MAG: tRNA (guanosine(37)-N1)-methyltransferase TrmD [Phycisphaerales bacterium]|nr:MAG: tRNA (guanosine(37)-N1)-methyltransferase TrmD [Phycisphaerales bacterium]
MRIDILTLFPEVFGPFFSTSIVGRAVAAGLLLPRMVDFREFTRDRHRKVDDRPFGGGPGMVIQCEPVFGAVEAVERSAAGNPMRILLTPQGEPLTQQVVEELAWWDWLILLCGHYEGFDERVRTGLNPREISIGDYVLSGGEPAAMVLIDAVVRLLPGSLGDQMSAVDETFSSGLLEYPQYTRPREYRGMHAPEILLSGDHQRIAAWRRQQAMERTRQRRPDLLNPQDAGREDTDAS